MKKTDQDVAGTSWWDHTVGASVGRMKQLLGEPDIDENGYGEKVNMKWHRETANGDVFTIYDWKESRRLKDTDMVSWHIGAKTSKIADTGANELFNLIRTLPTEPKQTNLCLVLEDITQSFEQADIEHSEIITELLKHNPYTPETPNHKRYIKWAHLTSKLIKEPIPLEPNSPASLRSKD